jgi:DNA polymerase III epsilon subunit-like protein
MSWTESRSTWFCVDIEANGPVPGLYDMVSLGVVAVAPDKQGLLQIGESLYLELAPVAPRFDARAAAIHGLDQERLAAEGLSQRAFCEQLSAWIAEQTRPGTAPAFVGHNAPFDWSHVSWVFAKEELPNPFGYKALCTKALTMGVLGVHWLDSNKEVLATALDLPAEDMGLKHRADYDAAYQAEILIGLLNRMALKA